MISNWRWLVAFRLFGTASSHRLMSFTGLLSIGGLSLAVAVLLTVLSVVNGFERELRERVLAVLPHATLYSHNGPLQNWESSRSAIMTHPDVLGVAPVVEGSALLITGGELKGVSFRGIDPAFEASVSILPGFIKAGRLDALGETRFGAVLGSEIAAALNVGVGDQVSLVLPDVTFSLAGPVVSTRRLAVVGLFEVGADMDGSHIYLHLSDAQRLKRQSGIDGLVIKVEDLFDVHRVIHELVLTDPNFYGISWMRQNGNLYDAIGTQKATLFLLLMILVGVASFNVVSNLVMTVDDNRAEIAILRTMGASPADMRAVFVMHGLLVCLAGLLSGIAVGLLLTTSLGSLYQWISSAFELNLMQQYFIRYLPTDILLTDVLMISVVSLIVSIVTTIYPATRAARANPIEALQYEV